MVPFVIIISLLSSLALLRLGKSDQPQCHKGASAAKALITGAMVVSRSSLRSWPEDEEGLGQNRHTSFLHACNRLADERIGWGMKSKGRAVVQSPNWPMSTTARPPKR